MSCGLADPKKSVVIEGKIGGFSSGIGTEIGTRKEFVVCLDKLLARLPATRK